MEFSYDTKEVLKFLDYLTENNIRKRQDVGIILETGAKHGEYNLVNRVIFSGKSFWNLSKTLQKTSSSTEGVDKLERQFENVLQEFKKDLEDLIEFADENEKSRIESTYLVKTKHAVISLIDLAHDLAKLKDLQIQSREIKKERENKSTNTGNNE